MKDRISRLIVFIAAALLTAETIQAQGTAFTYQGRLNATNGSYDFTFALYNSANNMVAGPVTNNAVTVSNGLFTTTMDFGSGVFTGNPLWLEIGVETNGVGPFETLSPRQMLASTPYAIFANNASNVVGNVAASQLTGTVPVGVLPGELANLASANGVNLTNIQGTSITGVALKSSTNVFNWAVKFVGGTMNASDANTGGMYDPWLTIAHAQANTPPGWTIAVMSGVHSTVGEYATNNAVNWYVNAGAYVVLDWLHPGTNTVSGNGELELSDWNHPWGSNVVCNITCNNCCPYLTSLTDGDYITINCLGWGLTNKIVAGQGEGSGFLYHGNANDALVTVYCKNFYLGQSLVTESSVNMPIRLFATGIGWLDMGFDVFQMGVTPNSIISAKELHIGVGGSGASFNQSQPFTYAVGLTYCNGYIPSFPSGMIFVGDPLFDSTSVTASGYKGAIQHY